MTALLRPNWARTSFGQIVTLTNGRAYKQHEMLSRGTPILRIQNLNGGINWFYSDLDLPSDKYCEPGDLLYAWSATFGPYVYSGPRAIFHYHIWNVKPTEAVHQKFAFYELLRITDAIKSSAHGVAMPHITKAGMEAWPLELPPLEEQQRIADKLDAVLARVDTCRDRLARVAPLLKRFRQSVLAAATSGRLTEDWQQPGGSQWASVTLESLCASVSDGPFGSHLKSDDYVADGVRVVRLENIGHLCFDASKETYISQEKYTTLERHTLIAGDLLFSSFVDEEVRVCRFPGDLASKAINKADCFCLRVNPKASDPNFVLYRLACKTTFASLKEQVHGATRPRINLGQLRRFELMLPSRAEQAEIVRRVETLFAFADRLEARLTQAQTAVDRLTPALLAKAFRGELVPQDPADEPAAELLARLRHRAAENGSHASPRRRRARRPAQAQDMP